MACMGQESDLGLTVLVESVGFFTVPRGLISRYQ